MDYDLTRLGAREFEHLTQALAVRILGTGVSVFGDGRDGGREATFNGRMRFPKPDPGGPWDGYGVLQSKFRSRPLGTSPDTKWFLKEVARELAAWGNPNSSRARCGHLPDYMILATNVVLSSVASSGGIDRVEQEIKRLVAKHHLPLKGWRVWHFDQIRTFLDLHPEIRQTYDAMVTPSDVLAQLRQGMGTQDIPRAAVRFSPGSGNGVVTDGFSRNVTNRLAVHHSINSTSMDLSHFRRESGWLVKMHRRKSNLDYISVAKLAEARWIREVNTPAECLGEIKKRLVGEIAAFERLLVLCVTESLPVITYQLYEVPRGMLVECIATSGAEAFKSGRCGFLADFSHQNGDWLFRLSVDRSVEKVSARFALAYGIDHGTWTVTVPQCD
ncbi:hypothetical protein ABZ847_12865 [Streptomyces bauhiniae]